jgi:hypothetical protein
MTQHDSSARNATLKAAIDAMPIGEFPQYLRDRATEMDAGGMVIISHVLKRASDALEQTSMDDEAFADDSLDLAHTAILGELAKLLDPKPQTCAEAATARILYSAAVDVVDDAMGRLASPRTSAVRDVLRERVRQVEKLGWTHEHDDQLPPRQIAAAAACYALSAAGFAIARGSSTMWPWGPLAWKPDSPRRMLVKAGALILAEIERLDRQAVAQGEQA